MYEDDDEYYDYEAEIEEQALERDRELTEAKLEQLTQNCE